MPPNNGGFQPLNSLQYNIQCTNIQYNIQIANAIVHGTKSWIICRVKIAIYNKLLSNISGDFQTPEYVLN